MHLDALGTPVLEQRDDVHRLDMFLDKLTDAVYARLPRYVRLFLSRDALRALLGYGVDDLATRVGL